MLAQNLIAGTIMVGITTTIHFFGLAGLIAFIRKDQHRHKPTTVTVAWQGAAILFVVFGLFGLHMVEIWLYAVLYMLVGEFEVFEEALYFSTSAFTTVGFGDLYLDQNWRMLSAIESASGFLLIGWSTAFLVSVTAKLRLLEAEFIVVVDKEEEDS